MDIVVLLVLAIIVLIVFQDTKSLIYFAGIADIFMRLAHFVKVQVNVMEFTRLVNEYIPTSLVSIISDNSEGIVTTILNWFYIVVMVLFLGYLIKYLFKGK